MAIKNYNFTRTELMAGAMVLVSVLVLIGFVVVVEQLQTEPPYKTLYARFTSTLGLSDSAIVRFGGLEVGRVADITYDPEDQALIKVEIHVDPNTPVNQSSLATVEQVGLTAEKHLEISTGSNEAALLIEGDDMSVVNSGYGFIDIPDLDGLIGGSEGLIGDLRSLIGAEAAQKAEKNGEEEMASIARILGDLRTFLGIKEALEREAAGGADAVKIETLLEDLRKLVGVDEALRQEAAGGEKFASVAEITGNIDGTISDMKPQIEEILTKVPPLEDAATELLTGASAMVNDNKENIDSILTNVNGITTSVNNDLEEILDDVSATLKNLQGLTGEAGDLLEQNRPAIEDLIGDLGRTIQSLNVLLDDLKTQPQSVLFGRPETGRK